ncbi:MAG TPA: hypothetical protein VG816_15085 [Solirubrobacterales bacterium]|nr:hypothetical protein [Solirubrobacterales bacterium]
MGIKKVWPGSRCLAAVAIAIGILAIGASSAAAAIPTIQATWVTEVNATAANLRTKINNSAGPAGSYRFELIAQAADEANLKAAKAGFTGASKVPASGSAPLGLGSAEEPVQHAGGLTPLTSYLYRVVATNSSGTATGPEHPFTTQETAPVFHLPDGRAWEMVSPVDKDGGAIQAPGTLFGGGDFQAASQGSSLTYSSATAFAQAKSAPPVSQYISTRTSGGWATQNVSPPIDSASYGDEPDGAPFRLFAESLSSSVFFGGEPCRGVAGCPEPSAPLPGSGAPADFPELYLRDNTTGAYQALITQAEHNHSAVTPEHFEASLVAATSDLSHLVISSCAALTPDATEVSAGPGQCNAAEQNLYEWSGGALTLLNLLPSEATGTPGAEVAASLGAISTDGTRVYFTTLEDGALYLREGSQTKLLPETIGGGAAFQVASSNGGVAYFTHGSHLYRYEAAAGTSTDIAPGGGVTGVLGASADGSVVYFQDAAGVERWQEGTTTTVAAGAEAGISANYPPATGAARVSADGSHLAFLSAKELGDYENAGQTEVFIYGSPPSGGPAQLVCASCNPTGERPEGSASLPGAQKNGSSPLAYKPRALSADGQRLYFQSSDDLNLQDTNKRPDVYQWEAAGEGDCARAPGCVNLISSGRSPEGATFLDASASGSDAYFLTDGSLVSSDPGSIDVYDARVGGGFPEAIKPIPCEADACQALPPTPEDPTPGTLLKGPENPPLHFEKEKQKKPKHGKHHKGKHHHKGHKGGKK